MEKEAQKQLIYDLSHEVVTNIRPQEALLVRQTVNKLSDADIESQLKRKPGTLLDDVLGTNVGEVVTLVTPIIVAIVTELVKFLIKEYLETRKKKPEKKEDLLPLSPEQLAQLRVIVLSYARQYKVPDGVTQQQVVDILTERLSG